MAAGGFSLGRGTTAPNAGSALNIGRQNAEPCRVLPAPIFIEPPLCRSWMNGTRRPYGRKREVPLAARFIEEPLDFLSWNEEVAQCFRRAQQPACNEASHRLLADAQQLGGF